jgi:hypothetical protein
MWGSVLVVTLLSALNPVRLALTLLMVSRPRPLQNLLAFWAGCLTGAIFAVVVPLALVHVTSMSDSFGQAGAASSTVRHVKIGMGVLALSMAALMTAHSLTRRSQRAQLLDSNTPTAISRLLGREQHAPAEGGSAFRRLLRSVRSAWENGSLWIAYAIGLAFGGPQPDVALFVVAIIVGSGAAIATQVISAIVYVVGMLAFIEIMVVGYIATPAKTQALLGRLHDWALAHRRQLMVAIFAGRHLSWQRRTQLLLGRPSGQMPPRGGCVGCWRVIPQPRPKSPCAGEPLRGARCLASRSTSG